jgi:splicing factor 3B subunit 1
MVNEFTTPDEELRNTLLRVVGQCLACKGVEGGLILNVLFEPYMEAFWTHRTTSEKRNYKLLLDTTVSLGHKIGSSFIIEKLVPFLKEDH